MSATPIKRKLAAILAADAVGYSRLMATDEEATMKLLAAHRAVIDSIIEFQEGRIVNTAGDSVIAEFGSAVQAVRCAVEIQDALRTRNDTLSEDTRMEFRIGVNLGDVMIKGDDLLGDGINVAARLEGVADPGGICVSSSVYDQIAGKLDLGFVDVGPQTLKNIERPVRVYRIERNGRRGSAIKHRQSSTAKWLIGLSAMAALVAGVWQFALVPMQQATQRAEAEAAARAADAKRQRQDALARVQAEAEKQRTEAEAAKQRAESALAKQRAIAEAAKQRAKVQIAAANRAFEVQQTTKRALEAQRAASAEIARLRADAEESKRKAAAELTAAAEARRAAEARTTVPETAPTPAVASLLEGQWTADISCPSHGGYPPREITAPIAVVNGVFVVQEREPGEPGSLTLRGRLNSDGTVLFGGKGISGRLGGMRPYRARFAARPAGEHYEGSGRLGGRECKIALSRSP